MSKSISLITLIIALSTVGVFVQVGNLGGQIRHTEIRTNSNAQLDETRSQNSERAWHKDDDD